MSHIYAGAFALSIAMGAFSAASAQKAKQDDGSPPPKDRSVLAGTQRQADRLSEDQSMGQPPDRYTLALNHNWSLRPGVIYRSLSQIPIDMLSASIYSLGDRKSSLEPPAPHYWVDDSLIGIVSKSGRMSRSLRHALEREMTRNGLKSLPGGQNAWDRVRRMDEAISRLGSEASYISQSAMRESAIEVLDLARQVANSFSSYTNLRRLVRKEWEDLQSELNELACYFREPGIR